MESAGGVLQRDALVGLHAYWKCKRFAYSGSDLIYMGFHAKAGIGTDDDMWAISKLTYSGNDLIRVEGPLTGAWDDRASLDWI